MSRIGRKPIPVPAGVDFKLDGNVVTVKGPKGTLTQKVHPNMHIALENGEIRDVTGYTCKRGHDYARKEVTNPTRIVTSTVRLTGSRTGACVVSCKTAQDIPKGKIFEIVAALKGVMATAPVHIGDVLLADVAGTGVDIIATKNVQ